ncbi:Calcium release-activated calcium channel protein [Phytophthora cinnamomi]|uniref:Calcium release-activated calcium channel protein n=1 Tax=Phytophthora cinnamomi TaxID=4785 RepID=UPI00355A4917|nr:Calcium release-activated calcium channel protein [Phytophthora cinnamomi]KAG6608986.1 Calcium release-activated calcium channel protein [Phytophthora cinnamomi]
MASSVVSALFGSYDLRNAKQWRDEDMAHREQEVQWLNDDIVRAHQWRVADTERFLRREKLQSEHVVCEARAEQLSTVSEQCTLLCGFIVSAMCNVGVPADVRSYALFLYTVPGTAVCVAMLICAVMCTNLQLAVTRYAAHSLEDSVRALDASRLEWDSPFSAWWLRRCEQEQMTAYKFLLGGVALFFFYLGAVSWIQFYMSTGTSLSISSLSLVGFLVWQLRIASKWRYLLSPPSSSGGGNGGGGDAASTSGSSVAGRSSVLWQSYLSAPRTPASLTLRKSAVELAAVPASASSFA